MKAILTFFVLIISTSVLNAQKEYYNWDIGRNCILNFDSPDGEPVVLHNSIMPTVGGNSTISTPDGKHLFSCNGTYAYTYSKEPAILKNANGLSKLKSGTKNACWVWGWGLGNGWDWGLGWDWNWGWYGHQDYKKISDSVSQVIQSTIILKQPGSNNNYYVITCDRTNVILVNNNYILTANLGLNYSIVDLNLNNGAGQYTEINRRLGTFHTSGQMTAVWHANKKDIWIIVTEEDTKNINAYLLTENGIDNTPVTSVLENKPYISPYYYEYNNQQFVYYSYAGPMRTNLKGDMLAITITDTVYSWDYYEDDDYNNGIELCHFDNQSGKVETKLFLKNGKTYNSIYGLEFSPDGSKLYYTSYVWDVLNKKYSFYGLTQKDISVLDIDYINKNTKRFVNFYCGVLQLAPNGKIYVRSDSLRVINKPNLKGDLCNFGTSVNISYCECGYSLPNILIDTLNFSINPVRTSFCEGEPLVLTVNPWPDNPDNQYIWTAPDGKEYTGKTVTIPNAKLTDTGLYKISMDANSTVIYDSVQIFVNPLPKAEIIGNPLICNGESVLQAKTNDSYTYLWSTGETAEDITVNKTGIYKLFVTNEYNCTDSAEINVQAGNITNLELTADKTGLCLTDSAKISVKSKYSEYLWSTGETSESITVHNAGTYSLIVKNEIGCADTAEIEISKFEVKLVCDKPAISFNELCTGNSKSDKIKFTLESNSSLNINKIYFNSEHFKIGNLSSLLKTYQNGESDEAEIVFSPKDAGEFFDTLHIVSEGNCFFESKIPVYGSSKALFRFTLPDIITEEGKKIEIPVYARQICTNPENLSSEYETEILIDKEYFLPESVQTGIIIENKTEGNFRVLKIRANADFVKTEKDTKIINTIYGQTLIGRSEVIPLTLNDVKFKNGRYISEYTNGSLKINGCVSDLSAVQMFNKTMITISPNPADGDLKVKVGTQERGNFSIIIYDLQGREVANTNFSRDSKSFEELEYSFNINDLGTGVYIVHLKAPWSILRQQLVISK